MRYLDSYRFVFQSPNGKMNLLLCTVCVLIPAVGPLILMGYLLEVIEWLDTKKRAGTAAEAGYPDFDFNRFSDYLTRGIWPFLVSLVISLPVSLLIMILWMVGMGVAAATGSGAVTAIVFLLLLVVYFAAIIGMNLIHVPLYLRAGFTRDFKAGLSIPFVKDFIRRVGKEMVLSLLFLFASGTAVTLVGMLVLCVGMYPAIALYFFAFNHQVYQLYELYLERGGEPIPLPVQAATPSR